jgi:hypothetical protein
MCSHQRRERLTGGQLDRAMSVYALNIDKPANTPIVKSSEQETPPDSAANTIQGLTDHADGTSMAAESNSNLALSSRQLLPPAVGDFSVSSQVEYCPPPDALVAEFAFEVCGALGEAAQSADLSSTETRQGFRQFMVVVARITAKQVNAKGRQWTTQSEGDPHSNAA